MNLLSFLRPKTSAPVARERLQILLAHERAMTGRADLIAVLREEILAVIGRHLNVAPDGVNIRMDRGDPVSLLEIDIEIPTPVKKVA